MNDPRPNLRPDWAKVKDANWKTKLLYAGPLALMVAPFMPFVKVLEVISVSAMDISWYGEGIFLAGLLMLLLGHGHASGVKLAKGLLVGVAVTATLLWVGSYIEARDAVGDSEGWVKLGFGFYFAGLAAAATLYGAFSRKAGNLVWNRPAGTSVFESFVPVDVEA